MSVDGMPRLVISDWDGTVTKFLLSRLLEHQKRAARLCGLPIAPIVRLEAYERNGGRPYASFDEAVAGFWPNAGHASPST